MLESIGASSVAELFHQIPAELHMRGKLDLPAPMSEIELRRHFAELASANSPHPTFLGAGIYDHYIPSTVPAIIGRAEFYTCYTPYQPEISQGTLQSIFEFQTLICDLTRMEVANASLYDGATALAEAALMASSITGRSEWVVSECVNPAYRETLRTYAWASGHTLIEAGRDGIVTDFARLPVGENTACVIVQHPNFFGALESMADAEKLAHGCGALFVVSFDPISLGLLKPPGEYDADIAVAEGQSLGIPMSFGGPGLGLFACKQQFVRQMPGRVVGATTELVERSANPEHPELAEGCAKPEHPELVEGCAKPERPELVEGSAKLEYPELVEGCAKPERPELVEGRGYVLTLQTREQHIRREKATSNICTNQGLCALAATVYLCTLGKHGLRKVAELCVAKSHHLAEIIPGVPGYELPFKARFFKEFVVKCPKAVAEVNAAVLEQDVIGGLELGRFYPDLRDHALLCVTEQRTDEDMDALVLGMAEAVRR